VAALVNSLEVAGKSVKVTWAMICQGRGGDIHATFVPLKDFGEPLHLGRLAFALANPAMTRRIFFRFAERLPYAERRAFGFESDGYYGMPGDFEQVPDRPKADVEVNRLRLSQDTPDAIVQWVFAELERQGVTLKQ
jgi:hypothetical protein